MVCNCCPYTACSWYSSILVLVSILSKKLKFVNMLMSMLTNKPALFLPDQEAAFVCPECDDLFGAFPDFEKHCRDDHR